MAVFLGVSKTRSFLALQPGAKNFWCVGGASKNARAEDLILLYFPANVSPKHAGINQVYRITSAPHHMSLSDCAMRGMQHVDTELLLCLETPITIKDLKQHPVLSNWGAVRRNMQGVTFPMSHDVWLALRQLMIERNPEAADILAPVEM